jgi:ABC-type bacteriocin/lantibiotic exporter with double-glycine peptidase domain
MILLMFYHPLLLGFSIIILISLLFVYLILSRGAVRTAIAESDAKYQVVAWLEDIASHPLLFKSGDGMQYALKRSDQVSANWLDTRESHFRILLREKAAALVIQTLASAGILGVGGYLVIIEQLSLGQLVASEIIVTLVLGGITKFTKQVEYFYELIAGVAKLDSLSNFPLEDAGGDKLPMEGKPIELVFQRFVQQFEGNKILEIDQFKIESGSKVAIYGANGSGKSALADTLFKLHPTSSGTINFDGTNIADLSIESVRNCVALIRDAEIFHGSVDDNIRLGNESFSKKEVRAALEAVGLTEEIESLPDGLDTMLHPWGVPLSRGQTHRLILARALLRSPRLLIIDGLLDSIDDAELERTFRTLQSKDAPWTLIVFTHEFHVMEHFDKRYLLEDKQLQICPRK